MEKKISLLKTHVLGSILLVAGCCIGAGMLGLPVLSAPAGFIPSVVTFSLCWVFMLITGLLLLEVNLAFPEQASLISMVKGTLGRTGQIVSWLVFLFLFYSLMVAYVAGSSELFVDFLLSASGFAVPTWVGSLIVIVIFGSVLYAGTLAVDRLNRLLMLGLAVSYACLISVGLPHINSSLLLHRDWALSTLAIPAMIVSFGFHNLVPTLTSYLKKDRSALVTVLTVGSLIPLFLYVLWEYLVLGLVPLSAEVTKAISQGDMATHLLKMATGENQVVQFAQYFAFFSIVTSFLGVALSLVDFLSDGLNIPKTPSGKLKLCALVLTVPIIFTTYYPDVFLIALTYAGGYGAVILFGIFPALMVWSKRYHRQILSTQIVPGGKWTLVVVILVSLAIMALQLKQSIGG